jgi:hypothetical protein
MDPWVAAWYTCLCVAGVSNLLALLVLLCRPLAVDPARRRYQKLLRALAVPVVIQCAWRGFFPSLYLQRYTFWDTLLNSILLDRTLACVGELAWNTALARTIIHIDSAVSPGGTRWVQFSAAALVLIYIVAECTSYYNTATTNEYWAAIEVALDAISQVIAAPAVARLLLHMTARDGMTSSTKKGHVNFLASQRSSATVFCALFLVNSIVFPLYNFTIEVPMYLRRYAEDRRRGKTYLPFVSGLVDAALRRVPTQRTSDWREDMFWMVAYFVGNPVAALMLANTAPTPSH